MSEKIREILQRTLRLRHAIYIFVAFAIPVVYLLLFQRYSFEFWDATIGSYIATVLGLAVGVPIGLEVNRLVQEREAKERQAVKAREAKERKGKILGILADELKENDIFLKPYEGPGSELRVLSHISIKDTAWRAFSDGGELEWIKDTDLLVLLSNTYYSLEIIKTYQKKYFDIEFREGVGFDMPLVESFFEASRVPLERAKERVSSTIACLQEREGIDVQHPQ